MRNKIHQQTFIQATFWLAAAAVGAIAVLYARIINEIFKTYSAFFSVRPYIATAATPFLFVLATYLVVKFSPQAKGSGIPQVLTAISYAKKNEVTSESDSLVSLKTAVVKVVSTSHFGNPLN